MAQMLLFRGIALRGNVIRSSSTQLRLPSVFNTVRCSSNTPSPVHPYPWPKNWLYDPQLGFSDYGAHGYSYKSVGRARPPLQWHDLVILFVYFFFVFYCFPFWFYAYNAFGGKWRGKTGKKIGMSVKGSDERGLANVRWDPSERDTAKYMNDDSPYKTAYKWRELMNNPRA